jgi:hypothetical protein
MYEGRDAVKVVSAETQAFRQRSSHLRELKYHERLSTVFAIPLPGRREFESSPNVRNRTVSKRE